MYVAILLLPLVTACTCSPGYFCTATGSCCPFEAGVVCGDTHCCPSGSVCVNNGQECVQDSVITASLPIPMPNYTQCDVVETRLRTSVQTAMEVPSFTTFLAVIDTFLQGKELCQHHQKLAFSPGSCMVDFLLLETDTRVSYWSFAKGDIKAGFSAVLKLFVWLPYLHADCLV